MKKIICFALCFCLLCVTACKKNSNKKQISNCELIIEYFDDKISGRVNYEYIMPKQNLNKIIFNLYPRVFEGYEGCFNIKEVIINQNLCKWEYKGEKEQFLDIVLPESVKNKVKADIAIEFECSLKECNQRLGIAKEVINLAFFYPIPCIFENGEYLLQPYVGIGDPFCCEFYNFDIYLTLPSTFTVASGASTKSIEILGSKSTYFLTLKNATNFACSLSENFHIVSKKWGNKRVNYYYCFDNTPEKTLDLIINALDYFNKKIGDYAYENFSIVVSDYMLNGMEYSAFGVIKSGLNEQNFLRTLVHEIAHQWFGSALSVNQYQSAYFNEGLAEYLTTFYLADIKEEDFNKRIRYSKTLLKSFITEQYKNDKNYKPVLKKTLNEFSSQKEYQILIYEKGFLLFNHLNGKVGGNLIKYLSAFYKNNLFKVINEDDFIRVFKGKSKKIKEEFNKIVFCIDNDFVALNLN